jgi:hypothetical protein
VVVAGHPLAGVDYPQRWAEFEAWFPDEAHCLAYLARLRWPDGFRCERCGHEPAWLTTRQRLICAGCRHQSPRTNRVGACRAAVGSMSWNAGRTARPLIG